MSSEQEGAPEFGEPTKEEMAAFMDTVDEFIHLANHLSREASPSKLAAAMMFAAARYSAYMWQHYGQHLHSREETIGYLVGQFEAMLEDNIDTPLGQHTHDHDHEHGPDCGHQH
jgi:hypothetical protein